MVGDAAIVLTQARAVGLEVRVEPGRLIVRGPRALELVARQLLEHKAEVTALLAAEDAEVAWRVEAMRPQVPRKGAIPLLIAREMAHPPKCCVSCGDPLMADGTFRCSPCTRAAWLILHELREDVRSAG